MKILKTKSPLRKRNFTTLLAAVLGITLLSPIPLALSAEPQCKYFHEYSPALSQSFQWWFDHIAIPHSGRVVNIPSEIELACADYTMPCDAKISGDSDLWCFATTTGVKFPLSISPDGVCAAFGHGKARQALLVYVWCPT